MYVRVHVAQHCPLAVGSDTRSLVVVAPRCRMSFATAASTVRIFSICLLLAAASSSACRCRCYLPTARSLPPDATSAQSARGEGRCERKVAVTCPVLLRRRAAPTRLMCYLMAYYSISISSRFLCSSNRSNLFSGSVSFQSFCSALKCRLLLLLRMHTHPHSSSSICSVCS